MGRVENQKARSNVPQPPGLALPAARTRHGHACGAAKGQPWRTARLGHGSGGLGCPGEGDSREPSGPPLPSKPCSAPAFLAMIPQSLIPLAMMSPAASAPGRVPPNPEPPTPLPPPHAVQAPRGPSPELARGTGGCPGASSGRGSRGAPRPLAPQPWAVRGSARISTLFKETRASPAPGACGGGGAGPGAGAGGALS